MIFLCHRLFLFIVRVASYQVYADLIHQLLVVKIIATCRLREFSRVAMLVLFGRVQHRVAIAEHNKAHHLLTEISSTIGKVVFERISGQGFLVRLASLLAIKVEDTRSLHVQHRPFIQPGSIYHVRFEFGEVTNDKIARIIDDTLTREILHHIPKAAQLAIRLTLRILFKNAFDDNLEKSS